MKALSTQELRIGNLVDELGQPTVVTLSNMSSPHFKPLPLTEHWLAELGFKNVIPNAHSYKNTYGRHGRNWFVFDHDCDLNVAYFDFKMKGEYASQEFQRQLMYVHQLQNLYFLLTNSELTLNP